jgi:tRNA (cytidine56-2'-O)-methyltransferase
MSVWILRLGHRLPRDERVSTHCGLVARALGAEGIIFSGQEDRGLLESLKRTVRKWGGKFQIKYEKNWRKVVKDFRNKGYYVIYLTIYGVNLPEVVEDIRNRKDLILIIGSQKVPGDVYELCDVQVAVGNQPHSEIAALAVFLDRYFKGNELKKKFNGEIKVVPTKKGKEIKEN